MLNAIVRFESTFNDPADYAEASCEAEYPADSFRDILAEKIKNQPYFSHVMKCVDEVIRTHNPYSEKEHSSHETINRMLALLVDDQIAGLKAQASVLAYLINPRLEENVLPFDLEETSTALLKISRYKSITSIRACCLLRIMGREPRSLEQIGKSYGVTRAFVDKEYRRLQDRLGGIRGRADKSQIAREKFRKVCVERGKRKGDKAFISWNIPKLALVQN